MERIKKSEITPITIAGDVGKFVERLPEDEGIKGYILLMASQTKQAICMNMSLADLTSVLTSLVRRSPDVAPALSFALDALQYDGDKTHDE